MKDLSTTATVHIDLTSCTNVLRFQPSLPPLAFPMSHSDPQSSLVLEDPLHVLSVIDCCDNDAQREVLRHHYTAEYACKRPSLKEDYCQDTVIYKVLDGMPSTYRGADAARGACADFPKRDLQSVSICQNHARVNWEAEDAEHHKIVVGTDSFTFDDSNHIKTQTIVAMSREEE